MVGNRTLFPHHLSTLRAIIEAVEVAPLLDLARRPGVSAVYRVTVHYHDGRARDSVATLVDQSTEGARLDVVYRLTFHGKALSHPISPALCESFGRALQTQHFDKLIDQPDLPTYGVDLWLIERAAGTYTRSVVLAPDIAEDVYARLAAAVRADLPEALRQVK